MSVSTAQKETFASWIEGSDPTEAVLPDPGKYRLTIAEQTVVMTGGGCSTVTAYTSTCGCCTTRCGSKSPCIGTSNVCGC